MAEGSPRTRTRVRAVGQRKQAQAARVIAQVQTAAPDEQIILADVFPAKEVLGLNQKGELVLPQNIAERVRYIHRHHSPPAEVKPGKTRATRNQDQLLNEYTRDFIFSTLHQLCLTGMPMDQVALKFDISLATAYRWRRLMMERMAEEVRNADPLPILGETLSTYQQIAAEGYRMMMTGRTSHDKRAGAEVALKAMGDRQKVLQLAGFYNNPLMKVHANGSDDPRTEAANSIMDMARAFLDTAPPMLPAPVEDDEDQ